MLGCQGNPKPDSPQEFASSPSNLRCVCMCVARLWVGDRVRLTVTLWKDGVGYGEGGKGGPVQSIKEGDFHSAFFSALLFS